MVKVRAEYIMWSNGELLAIYPASVNIDDVKAIAKRLNKLPGATGRTTRIAVGDPGAPLVAAVGMKVIIGYDAESLAQALKRLTRPKLPFTMLHLQMDLWVCRCGRAKPEFKSMNFIKGLAPEDDAVFKRQLRAVVRGVESNQVLRGRSSVPEFVFLVRTELDKLLAQYGIFVMRYDLDFVRSIIDPCKHRR